MKKKKREELWGKTSDELSKQLTDTTSQLFQLTMDHKMNSLKNTKQLSHMRGEIAIIQTIIREKSLSVQKESSEQKEEK